MGKSKLEKKAQRNEKEEEHRLLSFANFKLCVSSEFCISPSLSIKTGLRKLRKIQKKPSRNFLRKSCSENMQQIYRRTPIPKYDALQLY